MLVTASIFGASALVTFALLNEGARPQVRASGEADLKASLARLQRTRLFSQFLRAAGPFGG
jgi:hypothetical protein